MNAIMVIQPYKYEGLWVFDDAAVDLVREPFIAGADAIIDLALAQKGIKDGAQGFRLLFSANPFPGYDFELEWRRAGDGGNWYYARPFNVEGWLCPALFKYFDAAPKRIYAKFEARRGPKHES